MYKISVHHVASPCTDWFSFIENSRRNPVSQIIYLFSQSEESAYATIMAKGIIADQTGNNAKIQTAQGLCPMK